jgi:hypothetical protein
MCAPRGIDTVEHGQLLCVIEAMKIRAGDPIAVISSGDTE